MNSMDDAVDILCPGSIITSLHIYIKVLKKNIFKRAFGVESFWRLSLFSPQFFLFYLVGKRSHGGWIWGMDLGGWIGR
jgi:hypothetical protein